ncbi:hypothetical protein [Cytobacillus massiliigabonensis]|uniref:hypothetical protein n=1 Tax=Cytobacillus massiliigabonensis TaxID=1871011 RepID=UPI000C81A1B1|nr:hypothetical protein [Cytobacillus massiliigabonensis]
MKEKIEEMVQNSSSQAVEYAKSFDKVFNYTENNIADLEEILDYYSNDLKVSKPAESQIYSMSFIWGSYLGQLIKMHIHLDLCWVKEDVFGDGEIIHLNFGVNRIFPIDKVYKRLINGEEDNIISFYEVMKQMDIENKSLK